MTTTTKDTPEAVPSSARQEPDGEAILDKRLLFVIGKGGVGKSTISIALGLAAARRGKRVIVCEVAGQERVSKLFHTSEIGFHEVELRQDLFAISIDPDDSTKEYLELQLKVKAMGDLLHRSRLFSYLAAATPGLRELVTIGKVWELAQPERRSKKGKAYDLVIVDSPATGHGIGLLESPRTFAQVARTGPIHNQAKTLDKFIVDHGKTGAILVALPEEMPVNESVSLEDTLTDQTGVAVDRVYMNALYPERFSDAEAAELERAADGAEGAAAGAIAAALAQQRRRQAQLEQLERLRAGCDAPVRTLPFIFEPELDVPSLERLAEEVV